MRSLATKLTLAFLVVSLLGIGLVALLVNWQTRRQFDSFVQQIYQDEVVTLSGQLATYYREQGSWEGVETALFSDLSPEPQPGGPPPRIPVTLVDSERRVIFGDRRLQQGETLAADSLAEALPIDVDGETAGWLMLDLFGGRGSDFANSPEANFLANLNRITILIAIGAGLIALIAGILLARTISRPVEELQEATRRVAQGELGYRVDVGSPDEIGQLAAAFNQMSGDLARSNALRRQMTADIAHDLRTPLTVIQGYSEALDDGKLQGSPDIYGALHQQVGHLTRLVADLRTLSLADAGQLSLQKQRMAPRDLLEHSVLAFAPQAEQQQVALELDIEEAVPDIWVDPDRIGQLLANLISNALRHTPPGGAIRLWARPKKEWLMVDVQDSGPGIAPEDLPYVFDRFYRGDKARSAAGESGLGLAIARSIVEAHDGRLSVASPPGQGATFTIALPLPGGNPQ